MRVYTIPAEETLIEYSSQFPEHMYPNKIPLAVVIDGYLTPEQCAAIIADAELEPPYNFQGCHSKDTRELPRPNPMSLKPIEDVARLMNDCHWKFDLDEHPMAWMQTYEKENRYKPHIDGSYGQSRKLTAIALLSHELDFGGGDLLFQKAPNQVWDYIEPKQGTIVVFVPWLVHEVQSVIDGTRKSINMGFYGSPFK